jgi:GNAT superfamily N-acetyltransferase
LPSFDQISIHPADPDTTDWASVLALVLKALAYIEGRIDPPSSANRLTQEDMAAQAASGVLLLAEDDSGLVGGVFLNQRIDAMHLGKLALDPSRQGEGIGRRLFKASVAAAEAQNFAENELQARIELTEIQTAVAALGFRETGRTVRDGYDRPTSVTMRCRL